MKKFFGIFFSILFSLVISACVVALIVTPVFEDISSNEVIEEAAVASVEVAQEEAGVEFTEDQYTVAKAAAMVLLKEAVSSFRDDVSLGDFTGLTGNEYVDEILSVELPIFIAAVIVLSFIIVFLSCGKKYRVFAWSGGATIFAGVLCAVTSALIGAGFFDSLTGTSALLIQASSKDAIYLLQQGATIAICVGVVCLVLFCIFFWIFGRTPKK